MRDLDGKQVLITGAGHGIGRALALALAQHRARVLCTDRDEASAAATADVVRAAGGDATALGLDVTDAAQIVGVRDELRRAGEPLDVLVNNAGIVAGGTFLDLPVESHLRTYDVNLDGLVRMTHAFLPDLIAREAAWLVNVASASAYVGLPFGAVYASSKWGVLGLSESIRLELKETGNGHVGVTTVCPGYVATGMFDGVRPPRFTPMLSPTQLADRVIRAVTRGRPFVRTPWTVNLGRIMGGILPTRVFDATTRLFGVNTSMRSWRPPTD